MNKLVNKAKEFATERHEGQTYGTMPFIVHPEQTYRVLSQVTSNPKMLAAAWLHDTIEDTDTTYEELVSRFGEEVANLVMEVTHEGNSDSIGYYFPRLKTQRGIMLKFADRLSNISHMEHWSESKKRHYLKRSKFWAGAEVNDLVEKSLHNVTEVTPSRPTNPISTTEHER